MLPRSACCSPTPSPRRNGAPTRPYLPRPTDRSTSPCRARPASGHAVYRRAGSRSRLDLPHLGHNHPAHRCRSNHARGLSQRTSANLAKLAEDLPKSQCRLWHPGSRCIQPLVDLLPCRVRGQRVETAGPSRSTGSPRSAWTTWTTWTTWTSTPSPASCPSTNANARHPAGTRRRSSGGRRRRTNQRPGRHHARGHPAPAAGCHRAGHRPGRRQARPSHAFECSPTASSEWTKAGSSASILAELNGAGRAALRGPWVLPTCPPRVRMAA